MARIGICHFRTGDMDGVSLEIDKTRRVFGRLEHVTFAITGSCATEEEALIVPELALDHPEVVKIRRNAFEALVDYRSGEGLQEHIEDLAQRIQGTVTELVAELDLDLLVVHNLWGLPLNLSASLGVWRAVEALQLPVLAHHHDFYWEREAYARPTTAEVGASLRSCFPPVGLQVTHLVINGLAQAELSRRGIASIVVPNVFDFDFPPAQDPPREDLLAHLGLSTREVVFLQATRIVRRKGVEIALELVARLGSSRFREALKQRVRDRGGTQSGQPVLLLPNLVEDQAYYDALHNLALRLGVDARFVSDRVASSRRPGCISLWDAYRCADFATYPSLVEGWGNQFLEAIWSRLPMAVYEYPVFISDIAPVGFRYVSLGHCHVQGEDGLVRIPEGVLWQAAHEAADVLSHPAKYRDIVDRNYALGKARFSFRTLSRLLDRAVQNALRGRGGALCEL